MFSAITHKNNQVFRLNPLLLILLLYLFIQCLFVAFTSYSIDDFWLTRHTLQYKDSLPYRDFYPYKSVLGYYVLLIPMLLTYGPVGPLFWTKIWIILINTGLASIAYFQLKKFYTQQAVLFGLLCLLFSPTFFLFSSEIRVDILTWWLCLFSVLFIFDKKMIRAGLAIGLAFLVCQKAVWYIMASDAALLLCFICQERNKGMARNILQFNLSALAILMLYILFWSGFSDYTTVLDSLFYEPWFINNIDWYQPQIEKYRSFLVVNNLGILALCLAALVGLVRLPVKNRLFTLTYVLVILFFTARVKQPFAYTPMATFPALLILFSSFFSSLESQQDCGSAKTYWMSYLGFSLMLSVFIWSAFRLSTVLPGLNGSYQRSMLAVMAAVLNKGDSYIAGTPLLPTIDQAVPGLVHLVGPAVDYMYQQNDQLHAILSLRSLYFTPVTVPQVIESIKSAPVKLYVDNNRLHFTPPALHRFLESQYQHYWSSIYLYAPHVDAGSQLVAVKFAGSYRVQSNVPIRLDGRMIKAQSLIHLESKTYQSDAKASYRLVLRPEHANGLLHDEFREDRWWLTLSPW